MSKTFICDSCGCPIENIQDGWVEWQSKIGGGSKGIRLVHHRRINRSCAYDENTFENAWILADGALEEFLGSDGLMQLLEFVGHREFENPNEVMELIKRFHVEGYEQAFRHLERARYAGAYEPNTPPAYPTQADIRATIRFVADEELL